jgi:uncharacterized membrane protein
MGNGQGLTAPAWLRKDVRMLEENESLDKLVDAARPVGETMSSGRRGEILRGEWLGHALHPLLTDLPLGCWISSGLLDLFGGKSGRRASRKLTGLGLLFVPPTLASGWADWATTNDQRVKRVGVVHAVGNVIVAALYFFSWRARRDERHVRGKILGLLGGSLAWGTGYLGGHMSFGLGSSVEERGLQGGAGVTAASSGMLAGTPAEGFVDIGTTTQADLDDLVGVDEAAALASVPVAQVRSMVEEGLLTPVAGREGAGELRFRRADVLAVRMIGG